MTATRIAKIVLAVLLLSGCESELPSGNGERVSDFRLETLEYGRFYLNEHRGRVVLLAFWATYCLHCKQELMTLSELARRYPSNRLIVAAVCTDPENLTAVKRIASGLDLKYPILLDHHSRLFQKLKLRSLPTTIVIAPNGLIALNRSGFNTQIEQQLTAKIQLLLDGDGQ